MKEDLEEELKEKQEYLKAEILDKGYDAEKFSDYLSSLKANGTNINNWSFEELKNVVYSFVNQEKGLDNTENIQKEVENVKSSFILLQSDKSNNENPYDNIFEDKEETFKEEEKNIMSNLNPSKEDQNKNVYSEMGDFEILDPSEFIDSTKDILNCKKPIENSIAKYDDISVDITE